MLSLEEGETVQFQAQALFASARSTTSVSVTRGHITIMQIMVWVLT